MTRKDRLLLGLAVSRLSLRPGETRSHRDLGYFCDCPHGTIQHIERIAMRKMAIRLKGVL